MRSVATVFDHHLPVGKSVWTGPVSKEFRHSSLFFYLRRPVKTLSDEGSGATDGEFVILFNDEHRDLIERIPAASAIVESRKRGNLELFLVRTRPGESFETSIEGSSVEAQ